MGKVGREEEDEDEDKLDETYKRICKIMMATSANGSSWLLYKNRYSYEQKWLSRNMSRSV